MKKTFIVRLEAHLKVLLQLRDELKENTVGEVTERYFVETHDIIDALNDVGIGLLATDLGMVKYEQHNHFASRVKRALGARECILSSRGVVMLLSRQERLEDILWLVETIIEEEEQDFYFYDPNKVLDIQLRGFEQADKEILFVTEEPIGHALNHDINRLTELLEYEGL